MLNSNSSIIGICTVCLILLCRVEAEPNWSTLTAEELKDIPVSFFINATSFNIHSIPPPAIQGLEWEQLKYLNRSAFEGFSSLQINNFSIVLCMKISPEIVAQLPVESFGGLGSSCVRYLPFNAFSLVSASQLSFIPPSSISSISRNKTEAIHLEAWSGFTEEQVNYFGSEICSALNYNFTQRMSNSSYAGFSPKCFSEYVSSSIFARSSASQFSFLSIKAIQAFTKQMIPFLNQEAWGGWNCSQVGALQNCELFPSSLSIFIRNSSYCFTSSCISSAPIDFFYHTTKYQIPYLFDESISAITANQLRYIQDSVWEGFRFDQLSHLNSYSCNSISNYDLAKISPESINGMSSDCLSNIPYSSFSGFSKEQAYTFYNLYQLSANQIRSIPPQSFAGFRYLSNLGGNQCRGFTSVQFSYLEPTVCSNFHSECFSYAPNDLLSLVNSSQLAYFHCNEFPMGWMNVLNPSVFRDFPQTCWSLLSDGQFQFLTSEQARASSPSVMAYFHASQLSNVPVQTFSVWTVNQLNSLDANAVSRGATLDQLWAIVRDGIKLEEAWNADKWLIDPPITAFTNQYKLNPYLDWSKTNYSIHPQDISWLQIFMVIPNTIPDNSFDSNFLSRLNPITFAGFRADTLSKLTTVSASLLTIDQVMYINPQTAADIPGFVLENISPASFVGFLNNGQSIDRFSTETSKSITPRQVEAVVIAMKGYYYGHCRFFQGLVNYQLSSLTEDQSIKVNEYCSTPVASTIPNDENQKGEKLGVYIGVPLTLLLLVFLVVFPYKYYQAKKKQKYQSLQ